MVSVFRRVSAFLALGTLGLGVSGCAPTVKESRPAAEATTRRSQLQQRLSRYLLYRPLPNRNLVAHYGVDVQQSPYRPFMVYPVLDAQKPSSEMRLCAGPIDIDGPPPQLWADVCSLLEWLEWHQLKGGPTTCVGQVELAGDVGTLHKLITGRLQAAGWRVVERRSTSQLIDLAASLDTWCLIVRITEARPTGPGPLFRISARLGPSTQCRLPASDVLEALFSAPSAEFPSAPTPLPRPSPKAEPTDMCRPPPRDLMDLTGTTVHFTKLDARPDGFVFYFDVEGRTVSPVWYRWTVQGGRAVITTTEAPQKYPLKGKLVLLLGSGYESRVSARDVLRLLQSYVDLPFLPIVEQIEAAEAAWQAARQAFQTSTSAAAKYRAGRQASRQLQDLIRLYEQFGLPEAEVAPYRKQLQEQEAALASLIPAVRSDVAPELRRRWDELVRQEQDLRVGWPAQVSTVDQLTRVRQVLQQWQENLQARRELLEEMTNLGVALPEQAHQLEESRQALKSYEERLEAIQRDWRETLDRQYEAMKRQYRDLQAAWGRAIATPEEKLALQRLIDHVGRMLENRQAAQALGQGEAAQEVVRLQQELTKWKKILRTGP